MAQRLRCRELFISTGQLDARGQVAHAVAPQPATRWITAYKTLCHVAELAEKHEVVFHLEHLDTKVDHPGHLLPREEDVLELLAEVDSLRVKLVLEIYQVQTEEGNVVEVVRTGTNPDWARFSVPASWRP